MWIAWIRLWMHGARDIFVANARGPGAGRFLAATLSDVLESGAPLIAVRASPQKPLDGERGVDFVFAQDGADSVEVIRGGIDHEGRVMSTQIVRQFLTRPPVESPLQSELLAAIRAGDAVLTLDWSPGPRPDDGGMLAITMRCHQMLEIALGRA